MTGNSGWISRPGPYWNPGKVRKGSGGFERYSSAAKTVPGSTDDWIAVVQQMH